jgi:hypothetical protein
MKNNKGYYSWIHQLNRAGLEAQQNGFRMINEAKAAKITDPAKRAELMGQMPVAAPVNPESPSADPADVKDTISRLGPTTPGTIKLADGDVGAYVNLRRMKNAERLAQLAQNTGPVDAKPDGNANEVAVDGKDGVMADPDLSDFEDEMAQAAEIRKDALANRARREQEEYPEEPEDEYRYEIPTANWQTVRESITSKISKMMNENRDEEGSQRGRIAKGSDSETPARNPNSGGAPKGVFKGTEQPSQRLGKILAIVKEGPKKHGNEAYAWASEALKTMQDKLKKD